MDEYRADFLADPPSPKTKRLIMPFEFMPEPRHFKRELGPRKWGRLDWFMAAALATIIIATTLLLVLPR